MPNRSPRDGGAEPVAVEMDARLGLLLHALNTHTACAPVVAHAAREIAETWRRSDKRELASVLAGAGTVASLWRAISLHAAEKDIVLQCLQLVIALVEAEDAAALSGEIALEDLLASTASTTRLAVVQRDVDLLCVFIGIAQRLVITDDSASTTDLSALVELTTNFMWTANMLEALLMPLRR
ncbi:hypothetical protein P43SY_009723 [Pythium insidiosum]|uniref:Uncharacterized protein n=1 Tax=Pythium insidiosum TaxID=114742 RepID=A0AAD5M368_PYTIN|nr:hypothetical protein P43SY_009723 [Pythium insidiosum]